MVEDMPADAELARREISRDIPECAFRRVETKEDLLRELEEFRPDVVVSDYSMPRFDGMTALRLSIGRDPTIPVIILTGSMNEDTAVACMKAGATDYVIKEHTKRLGPAILGAIEKRRLWVDAARREREREDLFARLRASLDGTVHIISTIVEKRDPYTAGHQRRVALLAARIAGEMGLPDDRVEGVRIAGVLHDIGKVAIPSEILSKPSSLTRNEFTLIRQHPFEGYEILKDTDFPWPLARMVLEHHERINGSGYPDGRRGEDLLPESKILMVADVVEAMASHRPYRPALGVDAALDFVAGSSGTLFDPQVVDVCISLFRERGFMWDGAPSAFGAVRINENTP
jgi:putative nucleotidyltransferase with HDIG domain